VFPAFITSFEDESTPERAPWYRRQEISARIGKKHCALIEDLISRSRVDASTFFADERSHARDRRHEAGTGTHASGQVCTFG